VPPVVVERVEHRRQRGVLRAQRGEDRLHEDLRPGTRLMVRVRG
jgi:hypothetical protein